MSTNIFLFISFAGAVVVLFLCLKGTMKECLYERRKSILSVTTSLKKDLKFAELDREKSYNEYLSDKEKNTDWQTEAKDLYMTCYDHKKRMYESFIYEENRKRELLLLAKSREKKIKALKQAVSRVKKLIKEKNISFSSDFESRIKRI